MKKQVYTQEPQKSRAVANSAVINRNAAHPHQPIQAVWEIDEDNPQPGPYYINYDKGETYDPNSQTLGTLGSAETIKLDADHHWKKMREIKADLDIYYEDPYEEFYREEIENIDLEEKGLWTELLETAALDIGKIASTLTAARNKFRSVIAYLREVVTIFFSMDMLNPAGIKFLRKEIKKQVKYLVFGATEISFGPVQLLEMGEKDLAGPLIGFRAHRADKLADFLLNKNKQRKASPSTQLGAEFEKDANFTMKSLSSGERKTGTQFACICILGQDRLLFPAQGKMQSGSPSEKHENLYGLVPTERGDFTKIQIAILNDVIYGPGSTAIIVEWKGPSDPESDKAQVLKINSLLNTLCQFEIRKGSLFIYIIPQQIESMDNVSTLDFLFKHQVKPVLKGGEAHDDIIFHKGEQFWRRHGKPSTGAQPQGQPFVVLWFNRTHLPGVKYTTKEDQSREEIDKKENQLREMRHKTNITTMMKIAARYKSTHLLCYAGDASVPRESMTIKPFLDFRQSWKLPGLETILSQDELFDELALISGQQVLHIGFRSGRLESLVMQPHQKVLMLENSLSVIGNPRAVRYYSYSKKGFVFKPKPKMAEFHMNEETIELARKMKEEANREEVTRYGIPELPVAVSPENTDEFYDDYLDELISVGQALEKAASLEKLGTTFDKVDHSHKELVRNISFQLESELIKRIMDTITKNEEKKSLNPILRKALKAVSVEIINTTITETSAQKMLPRRLFMQVIAQTILRKIRESTAGEAFSPVIEIMLKELLEAAAYATKEYKL